MSMQLTAQLIAHLNLKVQYLANIRLVWYHVTIVLHAETYTPHYLLF